jgi:crotonobetainyl-CoA:carnitine CoA-transferase CaiB-like acyl-CoA transferase
MAPRGPGSALPLSKISVIEVADEPGTRYCGRLFAALGARVVRAGSAPSAPATRGAAAFEAWLDEGKEEAADFAAALTALGRSPDVVIAGQTPPRVAKLDAAIAASSLDTLRLGLTWFGACGPYRDWIGDDALIQALIGIAHGFGAIPGPPMIPQGRAPQIIAGATLFDAGLATLWGRRNGRRDRTVDVDILEASLAFTETSPPSFERMPGEAHRSGVNRFAVNHPMSIYPTADGWLGVTALTPAQWVGLTRLIDEPAWGDDPRFATSADRVAHADLIDAALNAILPTRPTEHWLMEGQKLRVPLAPVPRHVELLETEHWRGRGSFVPLAGFDGVKAPGLPFRIFPDGHEVPVPGRPGRAPLGALRVIDFSMGWAGPLCARHLADLGADVVKIESDIHYDWWRGWEPPGASDPPQYELKPVFNAMNRGKRGVSLDLTTPAGVDRAKALVAGADIVIENYAPGVMAKLGLGHEALQGLRPGLIMVSMGAFGASGPWSFFRAYGATVEQASGMPHANGLAAWPPVLQHGAYGDPVAGIFAAAAVLAVLEGREAIGGAWIDLAQVECLFQLGADAIIAAQIDGDPQRLGSRNAQIAPRCVVGAGGGAENVAVVVRDGDEWRAFCAVLGRPDWAGDPTLASPPARNARADTIEAALAEWAARRPSAADAAAELQRAGVPAAPVTPSHALAGEPHHVAHGSWISLERRHVGRHIMAAPPYSIDGVRPAVERPAPLLGEHTAEVLAELR